MNSQKVNLPRLKRILLNNFSLYENENDDNTIAIDLDKPVTCIIGANGLGKSTLLNCINYGLTGRINLTGKKIKSVSDFYLSNKYASEYFEGRIKELDRDFASVTVEFCMGLHSITVTRSFFPDSSVTNFTCTAKEMSSYEDAIVKLMGLSSFDQFVFLQLKVFTFDEDRECLFWRPDIITPTLFLTIGLDPEIASEADKVARESQRINSRVRNFQFEINKMAKRIDLLKNEFSDEGPLEDNINWEEAEQEYEEKAQELDEKKNEYTKLEQEFDFLSAYISELTIKQNLKKTEYDNVYSLIFSTSINPDLKSHPLVVDLYKGQCKVCNTSKSDIWSYADAHIKTHRCPLCNSTIENEVSNDSINIEKLAAIDMALAHINQDLDETVKKSSRIRKEQDALAKYIEKLESEMKPYSHLNNKSNMKNVVLKNEISTRIASFEEAIRAVEKDKRKDIEHLDSLKNTALKFQNQISAKYEEAQFEFIPKFKSLARAFTGLNVDISLMRTKYDAKELLSFSLALGDTNRSVDFQLSESQRFFLDIALRMAIVDYIADKSNNGYMLIDTPEGSLDIAYEVNAGEMFADFVSRRHQLVITANLNSSGLVKTLAKQCGQVGFHIVNMLLWANLTNVQRDRSELFRDALAQIEKAIGEKL